MASVVNGSTVPEDTNKILEKDVPVQEDREGLTFQEEAETDNTKAILHHQDDSDAAAEGRERRRHRLFQNIKEGEEQSNNNNTSENSDSSSTVSFLAHMNQPSPTEIRQWMEDTQETVYKVVTDWQQEIIDGSSKITEHLGHLIQFVSELEDFKGPPVYILNTKCVNNQGAFESVINVYLHLILISLKQVALSMEHLKDSAEVEHLTKKSRSKRKHRQQHKLLIDILGQFSMVAEDALNFLQAHNKILGPACEKILNMRNNLYQFLRQVVTQPTGQIIPLISNVSLEKIRQGEDIFWLQRLCQEHKSQETKISNFLEISVGSTDGTLVIPKEGSAAVGEEGQGGSVPACLFENVELSINERLELIKLLLKQLGTSLGSSDKACRSFQDQFTELHGKLMVNFQRLVRNLQVEKKHEKLKAENCSENLKESLCQLEVKFHQVERILEDIPQHLKRVIGVADYCSKQLMQDFGLETELQLEENSSWTSPIEELSEDFFKSKKGFIPGCFPYIWRIIVKIFFGGGSGSDIGGASRKLKLFLEEVRTEMEDFHKEIKMKELEADYGVVLKVPIHFVEEREEEEGVATITSILAKYAQNHVKRRTFKYNQLEFAPQDQADFKKTWNSAPSKVILDPSQQEFVDAVLHNDKQPQKENPENHNLIIVTEYKYVSSTDNPSHQHNHQDDVIVVNNDKRVVELECNLETPPIIFYNNSPEETSTIMTTTDKDKLKNQLDS